MKGLFSYPDVLIVCGAPQFHDEYRDILLNPNVIIEVVSETTEAFDRGEKFRRYRTHLPSLTDYLLVSQVMPFIDHFHIGDDGVWKFSSVEGIDGNLHITSIDCRLPLIEVYDRIIFPPEVPEPDDLVNET